VAAHDALTVLQIAASSFWEILSQNIELAMFIESVGESRIQEDISAQEQRDNKLTRTG